MIRICRKCGIDNRSGAIHKHHKNGNHDDNSPENIMYLCANCHMTLHRNWWKLSDIGMENIEIIRKHPTSVFPPDPDISIELKRANEALLGMVSVLTEMSELKNTRMGCLQTSVLKLVADGLSHYELRDKLIELFNEASRCNTERNRFLNNKYQEHMWVMSESLNQPTKL